MADVVVNRRLNIYIDETAGAVALDRLTKKENELVAAIEKGRKSGKDLTREMTQLADTRNKIGQLKDVIDGKVLPSLRMAEGAVRKLRNELKNIPADSEAAGRKLQELKRAEATLVQVKNAVNGVDNALKNVSAGNGLKQLLNFAGGAFLGGGALGVVQGLASGLKSFFEGTIEEAFAAEEATARFRAQLDNLGRLDVFERLTKSADKFAEQFQSLDNDDIIGVFEQLINYGKLTEDQINQLTPVIIDFAAKQRISLEEAGSVVIKALEGNGKALKEYGINVKDAKDETEAFGIIMTELKPKVEGAMSTYEQTTQGALAKTRQTIADLKEEIGTGLLPIIRTMLEGLKGFLDGIPRYFDQLAKNFNVLKTNLRDGFNFIFNPRQYIIDQAVDAGKEEVANIKRVQQNIQNTQEQYFQEFLAADKKQRITLARQRINDVKGLQLLLTEAEKAGAKDRVAALVREINIKNEYLRKYTQVIRTQETKVGTGTNSGGGGSNGNDDKKVKEKIDDIEKRYLEFSNRIEEATAPILSAFRKINEEAAKDLQTVGEALKKNIITPEEAEKSLQQIERVLNAQRESLQKKFGLGANPLGTPSADVPVEDRFGKDAELGAKELGIKAGNAIANAAADALKENDPIISWLNDPEVQEGIDQAFHIATELTDLFINLGQIRSDAEQAAFEKEVANNDRRRDSAKKLYDQKLISQKEYDRRVAQIDKQQEARENDLRRKQFERDKNAATAQALISGANAQLTTLAKFGAPIPPNFLGIAANILTLGLTAANIVAIRSAKPPQLEQGGFIPQGSSHKQGGISLIDNRSGARVGEVEGGEPILSKKTYARNKPLIDSLLKQSTGGMSMNIPKLNGSMKTVLESGGFIPRSDSQDNTALLDAITVLNQRLAKPIRANVIYGEYEESADTINSIKAQGMIS
jgi:hypothetical protein